MSGPGGPGGGDTLPDGGSSTLTSGDSSLSAPVPIRQDSSLSAHGAAEAQAQDQDQAQVQTQAQVQAQVQVQAQGGGGEESAGSPRLQVPEILPGEGGGGTAADSRKNRPDNGTIEAPVRREDEGELAPPAKDVAIGGEGVGVDVAGGEDEEWRRQLERGRQGRGEGRMEPWVKPET